MSAFRSMDFNDFDDVFMDFEIQHIMSYSIKNFTSKFKFQKHLVNIKFLVVSNK